jgi:hypothetical protein
MDESVSKTQAIRLIDVLILGPFLIYAGRTRRLSRPMRTALIVSGALTIGYNLRNYLLNRQLT